MSIEQKIFDLLLKDLRASNEFGSETAEKINQLINDDYLTDAKAVYDSLKQS